MANWCSCKVRATAGPEASLRSPRAQESLTVSTAARKVSGVEEDIFFLRGFGTAVTPRFIEHAQAFHEKALGIQRGGLLPGLAFEIDLKISAGPAQDLDHRRVARERPVNRMRHLAVDKIHFTLVMIKRKREQAALAAH